MASPAKSFPSRFAFRGGSSSSDEDDIDEIEQIEDDQADLNETAKDENSTVTQNTTRTRSKGMSLSAPFKMNAVVQEEAATVSDEGLPATSDDDDEAINNSPSVLAGGAATMVKEKAASGDLGPLDTSRASPLSSRLIEEDPATSSESEETDEASAPSQKNLTDVAKLWWVNVWTQQLSELGKTEETEDDDDDLTETDEEEATIPVDAKAETSDNTTEPPVDKKAKESKKRQEVTPEVPALDASMQQEDVDVASDAEEVEAPFVPSYVSSGAWVPIDCLLTAGLSSQFPALRASRRLRSLRKTTAHITGLHGVLSGKPHIRAAPVSSEAIQVEAEADEEGADKDTSAAVEIKPTKDELGGGIFGMRRRRRDAVKDDVNKASDPEALEIERKKQEELEREQRRKEKLEKERLEMYENAKRMERVREIDRLIVKGQENLQQLICEKDVLQRRPNPLFNYSSEQVSEEDNVNEDGSTSSIRIQASRQFKFPPDDLVEEYLDMMFWTRRLSKMNHTDLWKDSDSPEEDDDETLGDDLFTASADAHMLYQDANPRGKNRGNGRNGKKGGKRRRGKNGGGGSWLLRQSLGKGPSLGEKIGEAAETAAYKAVCGAVMGFLARALSSLHGINVMEHSDIRLVLEQAPDLPPVGEGVIPGTRSSANYAQETIKSLMKKKARKLKKRSKQRASDDSFVQRDAVTEMLLSHVQISAPLLKLFPLAWQRALLGNIITLSTALMSDFFDGVQLQILGHRLTFAFQPITEMDMINHLGLAGGGFNHRRAKPEEFEAAVRQTAEDLGNELQFLDRWHERALGSGVLRSQIANLIARIVLTLTDEVLSGARMDLFCTQAGGPRLVAGLEYRIKTT